MRSFQLCRQINFRLDVFSSSIRLNGLQVMPYSHTLVFHLRSHEVAVRLLRNSEQLPGNLEYLSACTELAEHGFWLVNPVISKSLHFMLSILLTEKSATH